MFKLRGESGKVNEVLIRLTNDAGNTDNNDRYRLKHYLNNLSFTNATFSASLRICDLVMTQLQGHIFVWSQITYVIPNNMKILSGKGLSCHLMMLSLYLAIWADDEKGKATPGEVLRVRGDLGSQISRQLNSEGGKAASGKHRPPLLPGNIPGIHLCWETESTPGPLCDRWNDTTRNRTRDLAACSAVPQTNAPPRAPHKLNETTEFSVTRASSTVNLETRHL